MLRLFIVFLTFTLASCNQTPALTSPATSAAKPTPSEHIDHGTAGPPEMPVQAGKGKKLELPSSVAGSTGYLSLPAKSEGKKAAIIVIQEWWGVDDWIRQNTDRFADLGYVALAVDLYRGKVTSDPSVAHELMRGLPEDRAMADLKGAFEYLASRPDVDPSRIGAIGWCMGGGYSLALATNEPRLAGAVINYGRLVTDGQTIGRIKTPILGNFGGMDNGIPPESVRDFEAALKARKVPHDIKIYPEQGHGFMNPINKKGYDPKAAEDAWKRIDKFFMERLRRAS